MFIAVERLFFAVDWGTLKNAKLQAPNFGSAYLKWKKVKKKNKPSSLINLLCQNSCKINRLWKSRVNIGIVLYIITSIHTIYMYKHVYSMIYHNIHDKMLARFHQHIVDISLPRCDHKSWSLPASSSSGTTVWEKHAGLQNTQIDISYMLLHHANIFVWFSTHGKPYANHVFGFDQVPSVMIIRK